MLFQRKFGPIVLKEDGELSKQIDAVKNKLIWHLNQKNKIEKSVKIVAGGRDWREKYSLS